MTIAVPRRAFLASSAAAIAAPVAIASPATPAASDAVFSAIADFRQARAEWQATLDACEAADRVLQVEGAMGIAAVRFPLAGVEIELRTHDEISAFIPALRESCIAKDIAWDDEAMAGVTEGLRARLEAERERIEMIRCRVNADALEERQETASREASRCRDVALATVPTTLAGLRALADLVADLEANAPEFISDREDASAALASLATACRALLPAA
ncbi:MAG TPA: hypothetical protein VGV17_14390 [Bosea sp. (in: a-proteobacteria)]|jgi:hypothetical protein|uniref:hypothetical protein n=1 Tax=Bosea sp. (in: a-proteobacteria) TaxID=1871050 RepID=UPI002DDDAE35|nr:hypothetical protein [Bosea sp. (in: a-proteobacteria)]HEV2554942.1 hypothetical protein [Bosea sp. (in: a-proteobacteria)]